MNNPFLIAEIGINANGSVEIAKKLIDMAKDCGCDAVKFQKRTIDLVYTQEFLDSPRESPFGTTQRHQKEGIEFGKAQYDEIDDYCYMKNIEWFASAWDLESQKFLKQYNLKFNKIASTMLTHIPLLEMVAEEGKYTFISTGMSTFKEIDKAVEIFEKSNTPFCLMHCNSTYPCADEDINLMAMKALETRYGHPVGYSNHSPGILPCALAVTLGASAIEVHITLDRAMYGSDQSSSVERMGLEYIVRDCRNIFNILGTGAKTITEKEIAIAKKLRYFNEALCQKE